MQESVRRIVEAEESRMGKSCTPVKALYCFYVNMVTCYNIFHFHLIRLAIELYK